MGHSVYPVARLTGLVVQEMPDELLVYDLESNRAHCLNRSSAIVWKACDGTNSVADIVSKSGSDEGKFTDDLVLLAIDQLAEIGLMESKMTPHFAGQSRRHVLRSIGLASMVALPFVSSLVAPPSAIGAVSPCVCTTPAFCTIYPQGSCSNHSFCNSIGICAPN